MEFYCCNFKTGFSSFSGIMNKQIILFVLTVIMIAAAVTDTYSLGPVKQRPGSAMKTVQEPVIQNVTDDTAKQMQSASFENLQDSTGQRVIIVKNDGSIYSGMIITRNEREILIETDKLGKIYIPLHEIREIKPWKETAKNSELFATRYFLTTNALTLGQGNRYYMLSFYGPEVHFGLTNHFSVGLMTSWVAMPIIGSLKLSFDAGENFHIGGGLLAGTLSWADMSSGGILPYGCVNIGNYTNNLTLSAGYAWITYPDGQGSAPLLSPACMFRVGKDIFFVVDTFIYLEDPAFAIIMPGLRFTRPQKRSSLQFGFGALANEQNLMPMPVPVMSWFYSF